MGLLSRIIRDAVGEGISKGIRDAVGKATESVVAPKAEAYANKVAESIDNAVKEVDVAKLEIAADAQEKLIAEWNEKVPGFPVWCFGGTEFWFSTSGNTSDGNPYYWFNAENTTQEGLDLYVALLKENGFVRKYEGGDEVLYKDLGGEYLIFGKTDAFGSAPVMTVTMVRTRDKSEIEI